jgi:hypothetical protein
MRWKTTYIRLLLELSFSTYLALLVVTEEAWKESSLFLHLLGYPLRHIIYPGLVVFHIRLGGYFSHSAALWLLLALALFALFRLVSAFWMTAEFLQYGPGLIAVGGFPLVWLVRGPTGELSELTVWCLILEVIVVAGCGILFALKRWPGGPLTCLLLLIAHFGLWGWLTSGKISFLFWTIFLVLGFSSAIIWSVYAVHSGQVPAPEKDTV